MLVLLPRLRDSAGEIIKSAPKHISSQVKDVDAWKHIGEFLGNKPVTDIHPFKGVKDADRIFAQQADGSWRSLRFGNHEMAKPAGKGMHYHLEEWTPTGEFIKPDQSVNVLKTKGK